MYCHQCGEQLAKNSNFCSQCGVKVETNLDLKLDSGDIEPFYAEEAASLEIERNQKHFVQFLPILLPIFSFLLVTSGLTIYYFQEKNLNEEVLELNEMAEETALNGDYEKAKELLLKAQSSRPDFTTLELNLNVVNKAIKFEMTLNKISENIKKTQFSQASKELANLRDEVSRNHSPFFIPFYELMDEKDVSIKVGTVKQELNDLKTIDQLAGKLSILASLPKKEASAVKSEILSKIVKISIDDAESKLVNKQFTQAFYTIDKGLQYAINNEKLLAFKKRVEQEKAAFELAEQQRIEQAMEMAAQEDLKNRTAAVEVSDFTVTVDEYGDLYLAGTVENVATKAITSVTIDYSIYDENNVLLDTGTTSVYPYELSPGESGSFEDVYYGFNQDGDVEIDNITWYLN